MATTVVVSASTRQLLERANAKLDVLGHRIAAAEIREAQERKDAQARADAAAYLTSREHMLDVQAVQRECQRRADDALQTWGERAPAPIAGESVDEYRLRLANIVQERLPAGDEYRHLKLGGLPRLVFKNFEDTIYPRAKAAAERNDSVPVGAMRMVKTKNSQNGQEMISFYGQRSFIEDFKAPIRYVRGFLTAHGYYNTAGRYLHEKR
jgi:hypothetical protein